MTGPIGNAVEQKQKSPSEMIEAYKGDFAQLLPSHVNADQWARVAIGTLRRGSDELKQAAQNDPASLMAALSTAARLGLEAGTEGYYLTPRREKGQWKVLGIVGYQGLIELIYRAGAVSSVVAEVVHENDRFTYFPGRDPRPIHEIDWDAEDRGKLRLVYAYAVMKDGATSKVVVLNRADIDRIKRSSQGADSQYSPWKAHEASMWLKSAVRQLAKWVPTSAEFRKEQLRAVSEVHDEMEARRRGPSVIQLPQPGPGEHVDELTGEVLADSVDADVQDPPAGWDDAETAQPGGGQ